MAQDLVLVTGGAGFIGSRLVELLVERGARVRVADDLSTGRRENLAAVLDRVELVIGDLRNPARARAAVAGAQTVFHLAGDYSVPRSMADPPRMNAVNVSATVNVLWAAVEAQVARVVTASSCTVYGADDTEREGEAVPPHPPSPYAASKAVAELYAATFARNFGLDVRCLRYFNVYGPRQSADPEYGAAIPRFATALLRGERPTVYGDGKQTRDFVYVDDVARANLRAAEVPGLAGKAYNVGAGRPVTVLDALATVARALGASAEASFAPARAGERRHCAPDVSVAARELGWRAETDFVEGVSRTVAWYRAHAAPVPLRSANS